MIKTLYIIQDGDSYEVEYDTSTLSIRSIWRYANNRNVRPEICTYAKLDEHIRNRIDDQLLTHYGEPTNGRSDSQ